MNVFDREWDLLVILDACRPDVLEDLSDTFEFIPDPVPWMESIATSTPDWLGRTFVDAHTDAISETAYLSANPHAKGVLGPGLTARYSDRGDDTDRTEQLDAFVPLWGVCWDTEHGTVLAPAVTDHAIAFMREYQPTRTIVHYMQPHFPSVPDPVTGQMAADGSWEGPITKWASVSDERLRESYQRNLRYVLDSVSILLGNVNAETTVIAADHGEALGEKGCYGHRTDIPETRRVPWVPTTAVDRRTYMPDLSGYETDDTSVTAQLSALGYR